MTILATIHSPSAEVLKKFDRVIILSSGHTIYNGPTSKEDIVKFYEKIKIKYSKFSNPADVLLKLANAPKLQNKELSIYYLENLCKEKK